MQVVVLGFDDLKFVDQFIGELRRLGSLEVVRLVAALIVAKSKSGELVRVKVSDPTQELSQLGASAEVLLGFADDAEGTEAGVSSEGEARGFLGDERTCWVAEVIRPGKMALLALTEHRGAILMGEAAPRAGGATLVGDASRWSSWIVLPFGRWLGSSR
jgi:hypothetical protein